MKKKILALAIATIIILPAVACGNNGSDQESQNDLQIESSEMHESDSDIENLTPSLAEGDFKGFSFIYDDSWRIKLSDSETFMYLYPTDDNTDGFVMLNYIEVTLTDKSSDTAEFADGMTVREDVPEISYNYETEILDKYARRIGYTQLINESEYTIDSYLIPNENNGILCVGLCTPKNSTADYTDGFFKVLYTIEYTGGIDYPDKHISNVTEQFENGIAYYDINLTYDDWNALSYAEQCDIAEKCIEYCTDRAALYGVSQNNINMFAYNSNGETIFSYDGGDEVKFYTDGKYDFSYHL